MSSTSSAPSSKRVLELSERIAEVLLGFIMVLTCTGSLSVAEAGHEDVRTMLIGARGCNLAWGIIDAILSLMACLSEQAQRLCTVLAVRKAARVEDAHRIIARALPPGLRRCCKPGVCKDTAARESTSRTVLPPAIVRARLAWRARRFPATRALHALVLGVPVSTAFPCMPTSRFQPIGVTNWSA